MMTMTIAVALASACGNGGGGRPDAMPADANPFCVEALSRSDLAWLQRHIFSPSCADFTACHQGRALRAGELNLEPDNTHDQLVGQPSKLFDEYQLVVPGDPENSYLMMILGHYPGPIDPEAGTMPYNSELLCEEMRDAIARWIAEGALASDPPDAGIPDADPE
jgi:hypothetical protein